MDARERFPGPGFKAFEAGGEKLRVENATGLPSWARSTGDLLALAQKSQGWAFREYPPQYARLTGGCVLVVVPPWLWRPRVGPRPLPAGPPVPLRRAG